MLGERLISIETKSEIENVFVCRLGAELLARRGGLPPQTKLEFSFGNAISYLPNPKEGYGEEAQTQTLGFENMHLLQTSKNFNFGTACPARHIYMVR